MQGLTFTPDGHYIYAGDMMGTIASWDATTWEFADFLTDFSTGTERVEFSPDGNLLSHSLKFSPDGRYLASSSGLSVIQLWDVATKELVRTFTGGHTDIAFDVAYSPDGRRLLSGGYDGRVILWDVESGENLREYQHQALVTGVGFASGGRTVLSGSFDGTIIVRDAETWDSLYSYSEYPSRVTSMAVSPNGDFVAMGADDALVMYHGRWAGAGAVAGEVQRTGGSLMLYQNIPNPLTDETTIRYTLLRSADVRLTVSDALGKVLYEATQGRKEAGEHAIHLSTASMKQGIYFYHLHADGEQAVGRMVVVR